MPLRQLFGATNKILKRLSKLNLNLVDIKICTRELFARVLIWSFRLTLIGHRTRNPVLSVFLVIYCENFTCALAYIEQWTFRAFKRDLVYSRFDSVNEMCSYVAPQTIASVLEAGSGAVGVLNRLAGYTRAWMFYVVLFVANILIENVGSVRGLAIWIVVEVFWPGPINLTSISGYWRHGKG